MKRYRNITKTPGFPPPIHHNLLVTTTTIERLKHLLTPQKTLLWESSTQRYRQKKCSKKTENSTNVHQQKTDKKIMWYTYN